MVRGRRSSLCMEVRTSWGVGGVPAASLSVPRGAAAGSGKSILLRPQSITWRNWSVLGGCGFGDHCLIMTDNAQVEGTILPSRKVAVGLDPPANNDTRVSDIASQLMACVQYCMGGTAMRNRPQPSVVGGQDMPTPNERIASPRQYCAVRAVWSLIEHSILSVGRQEAGDDIQVF
jgi:hypothetical protein